MPILRDLFVTFDSSVPKQDKGQYASSSFPCVSYENISVTTNAPVVETPAEIVKTITINTSIAQSNFLKQDKGNDLVWYNNPAYLKNLRMRLIGCFGENNSSYLDLLAQRFNEFRDNLMPLGYPTEANDFLKELIEQQAGFKDSGARMLKMSKLLGNSGPFNTSKMLNIFKNRSPSPMFYNKNNTLSDVFIYDQPLSNAILLDPDGRASHHVDPTFNIVADKQEVSALKVILKPITIRIGSDQDYEKSSYNQLSLYAVIYVDAGSVVENLEVKKGSPENKIDNTMLNDGSGFFTSCTAVGNRISYEPQEKGLDIAVPLPSNTISAPDESKYTDASYAGEIKMESLQNLIHETFYNELIESAGVDKPSSEIIKNGNYFSPLWITKCDKDYARYCFAFDQESFLIENSQYPWLYKRKRISEQIFKGAEFLSRGVGARIVSAKMKKRTIRNSPQVASNRLGTMLRTKMFTPSYTYPESIVESPTEMSNLFLEEGSSGVVFMTGYDTYKNEFITGDVSTYQYGVEIEILDPAEEVIRSSARDLRTAQRQVMNVYEYIINSPPLLPDSPPVTLPVGTGMGLYNRQTSERTVPLESIEYAADTAYERVSTAIDVYLTHLTQYSELSVNQINETRKFLLALIQVRDPLGIKKVGELIRDLASPLESILNNVLPLDPYGEGTVIPSSVKKRKTNKTNIFRAEKYFDELFDFGAEYQIGYNYMSSEEQGDRSPRGLPVYSKGFFDQRTQEEFNKYFGNYVVEGSPTTEVSNLVQGYQDSSYQYFSPKTIKIFGEETLNQPSFRNPTQNVISYDLNKYGEIFYDIVAARRETKYLNHPYFQPRISGSATPSQLGMSVLDELGHHGCLVEEIKKPEFEVPKKLDKDNKKRKVINPPSEQRGKSLFNLSFGEGGDLQEYKTFLQEMDAPMAPRSTGSFGVLNNPGQDEKYLFNEDDLKTDAHPPIKLLFNILGELELRPAANLLSNYEEESFNSSLSDVNRLGITSNNVKTMIEGRLSSYPNQLKSLYVMAAAQGQTLLGTGFDAVRISLEDQDAGEPNQIISTIKPGTDFPPYMPIKDPMKVYAKFLTFWMNYKQIGVVEYLAGFENMQTNNLATDFDRVDFSSSLFKTKPSRPIWKKFSYDEYTDNYDQTYLCRWRTMSPEDVTPDIPDQRFLPEIPSKDLFDLPIYNKYFILSP